MYECRNWETEHYNCVLEIIVSFLGIHKWEPDIYIGFSLALHLQCRYSGNKRLYSVSLLLYILYRVSEACASGQQNTPKIIYINCEIA
jgi:hypothetical protein